MNDSKKYNQEEIDSNINTLTHRMDNLKRERVEVNRNIGEIRKQIKFWEEMQLNQYKMF